MLVKSKPDKLLLFSYHQFGLLIDTLKYCEYSKEVFNITYLGWDYGLPKIEMPGVAIIYVSRCGNLLQRNARLLKKLNEEVRTNNYALIFMHYTRGISLISLLNRKQKMIFDVRTLMVSRNMLKRVAFNTCLKIESFFFTNRTVISEGVASQLRTKNFTLLPLGADSIGSNYCLRVDVLHLLYVGTLENRDIIKCVIGFYKYIVETKDENAVFTIVGDSNGKELDEIELFKEKYPILKYKVVCPGRIPHQNLNKYFDAANVGISFIPIKSYYNFQPPTKTFEYLLSGLPVIATNTFENRKVLEDEESCILINDNPEEFSQAIKKIRRKISSVDPVALQKKYERHSWNNIVKNIFIPTIQSLQQKSQLGR